MRAMVLEGALHPLQLRDVQKPAPRSGQILLRVLACGVCRTDLQIVDGELTEPKLPLIPGHQIVGEVAALGDGARRFEPGDRVGVPWLGWSCGECSYCREGRENLCKAARYTGYHIDGGFADYAVADERFCFPIPAEYPDTQAAPLLCAGLIGYRSLTMAGEGRRLGLYGFGAAAHIISQVAIYLGWEVFAFTRPGDEEGQRFARQLGAVWAGGSDERPPGQEGAPLDAAIIFAPVGPLVPVALESVARGGTVVCAGIHMSDIPAMPYALLWGERVLRSVANLTRRDGDEFLPLASSIPVQTSVETFPLEEANEALAALREGRVTGSVVLKIGTRVAGGS